MPMRTEILLYRAAVAIGDPERCFTTPIDDVTEAEILRVPGIGRKTLKAIKVVCPNVGPARWDLTGIITLLDPPIDDCDDPPSHTF